MTLWACYLTYLVAGARSLVFRSYPAFSFFLLVLNAGRGLWFLLDPAAHRQHWEVSNYFSTIGQLAVTMEAYWILSRQVPNFSWRWRVLAVLCLPSIAMAGILAVDSALFFHAAFYFTQAAGFGLGFVLFLGFGLGSVLPLRLSPNSLIHAGVVSWMWVSSATGYHFYHSEWWGWWLCALGPAIGALAWVVLMRESGEAQPPADPPELVAAAERELERQIREREL